MGRITVVGAGWTRGELTLNAIEAMKDSDAIVLHTDRCGCADWLKQNGISYTSLDALYETCEDFDAHAQAAAEAVLAASRRRCGLCRLGCAGSERFTADRSAGEMCASSRGRPPKARFWPWSGAKLDWWRRRNGRISIPQPGKAA